MGSENRAAVAEDVVMSGKRQHVVKGRRSVALPEPLYNALMSLARDMETIRIVLRRCVYFLSKPNLLTSVAACDAMKT